MSDRTAIQIVLVQPEIPQNTGSIARTCAATATDLHLVGKLGFEISEKRVRRAGLDYWPYVRLQQHPSWDEYLEHVRPKRLWYFSKYASLPYHQADFKPGDALVFGSETKGLGQDFLKNVPPQSLLLIPIFCPQVRSLNLSNAVSIGLYEALRQTGAFDSKPGT
ncbi:MAG: tRNA (cytidine(34)-2'-O)-methyltransferase [Deltaproteobacteria bacterium]|nr:tRNA (cytidine(34)-2'-O)-methyltransferase [Deltaproteobacteria bacterium]